MKRSSHRETWANWGLLPALQDPSPLAARQGTDSRPWSNCAHQRNGPPLGATANPAVFPGRQFPLEVGQLTLDKRQPREQLSQAVPTHCYWKCYRDPRTSYLLFQQEKMFASSLLLPEQEKLTFLCLFCFKISWYGFPPWMLSTYVGSRQRHFYFIVNKYFKNTHEV